MEMLGVLVRGGAGGYFDVSSTDVCVEGLESTHFEGHL